MIRRSAARVVPREGERASGDAVLVRAIEGGVIAAVIDALGHGDGAAEVASLAREHLERASVASALELAEGLHAALRGTRGAACMIIVLRDFAIEGVGVGNVELRSMRAKIPAVLSPGVLGGHVRKLRLFRAPLARGERLALFSDGLSSRLDLGATRALDAESACDELFAAGRRPHDDASLLILDLDE